ncbi:MAG TPA: hypothetical protein VJO35_05100 [Terriglobales bacterium]|nr:hypothetical protein [Terriglobales bacterium]
MCRYSLIAIFFWSTTLIAQQTGSDPTAIALAQKSVSVLTGGTVISDVTLSGNVISMLTNDTDTGTAIFEAKGQQESLVTLRLTSGNRLEARNGRLGMPGGAWAFGGKASTRMAQHNTWTDSAWFFPALSSLSQTTNPQFIFSYLGQEQHNGLPSQHIRVFQLPPPGMANSPVSALSTMDFYLDVNSYLPLAVAFNQHADDNIGTNIPAEIRFANYRLVQGAQIPFHFQKLLNGDLVLDVTVTGALLNTGLLDGIFNLL